MSRGPQLRCGALLAGAMLCVAAGACRRQGDPAPLLFAAASLAGPLEQARTEGDLGSPKGPTLTLAASSTLAKQIAHGAPAGVFVSAHPRWVDYLAARGLVRARGPLVQTRLALVTPRDEPMELEIRSDFDFSRALGSGRLAVGDPAHVPAGIYAREALQRLGWWAKVAQRIVPAYDARAVLALVERGACRAGVVYEPDARASKRVALAGRFPTWLHRPIRYEVALIGQTSASRRLFESLQADPMRKVLVAWGFMPVAGGR